MVEVTVTGPTGSGKGVVMRAIEVALHDVGCAQIERVSEHTFQAVVVHNKPLESLQTERKHIGKTYNEHVAIAKDLTVAPLSFIWWAVVSQLLHDMAAQEPGLREDEGCPLVTGCVTRIAE